MFEELVRICFGLTSMVVGWLAAIRLPRPAQGIVNRLFGIAVNIDMDGASEPIGRYRSVQALFTRSLHPGARPVGAEPVSPADGTLSIAAPVLEGRAIQAKGIDYSAAELAVDDGALDWAWFATVYLAPKNYHRVHAPVTGILTEMIHVPGNLWPVNRPCVDYVNNLFCRNERLVFNIDVPGGGRVAAVMVAALNVGNMTSQFWPELRTSFGSGRKRVERMAIKQPIKAGDELGVFNLGSTVVLLFDSTAMRQYSIVQTTAKRSILVGNSLIAP